MIQTDPNIVAHVLIFMVICKMIMIHAYLTKHIYERQSNVDRETAQTQINHEDNQLKTIQMKLFNN